MVCRLSWKSENEFRGKICVQRGKTCRLSDSEANEWYRRKGIIHQLSTTYTPELNGTIERFMRTSKEMIGTMTVDSGLGHSYWDFAAKYSATIIMKISKGDDGVSSWFKLTGRQPNIHSILRFGSMCFVHVPKETRSKASFEATKAVELDSSDRRRT